MNEHPVNENVQEFTEDPAVTNFRKYLRIPSVHPDVNYDECVEFIKSQARELGLLWMVYLCAPGKPVVILTWTGYQPELPGASTMLTRHVNGCLRGVMSIKIVFLAFPIVVAAFSYSKQVGDTKAAMAHFMSQIFVELFVFCWLGELLSFHSLLVHKAAYESRWYEMNLADKKSILLVMQMAQRPIKLQCMTGFLPANLETFIAICRFSYSLYTLMSRISERCLTVCPSH